MLDINISLEDQEIFGWVGNAIFISGQTYQIYYTYKIKHTEDFSYLPQTLGWLQVGLKYLSEILRFSKENRCLRSMVGFK